MIPFILPLKHALKLPLCYRVAGELLPPTAACPTTLGRRNQSTSVSHVQVTFPPSYAREITLNAEYLLSVTFTKISGFMLASFLTVLVRDTPRG